ncbi:hypothetical protein J2S01_001893 [Pectinatus haikarae]|uniref:Uncharacterized protein n=1 Tax=Pectinatus haikarae TaxID=349096 RepID=A0ABT9Y8L0_9FIRM|nr:hypothetical protein [Pectinatus haikarae]
MAGNFKECIADQTVFALFAAGFLDRSVQRTDSYGRSRS